MANGPKFSEGALTLLGFALLGAPTVLGDHLNSMVAKVLFYGSGIALMAWAVWKFVRRSSDNPNGAQSGNFAGRDNSGFQQVVHGDVHYHAPSSPRPIFESDTEGTISARNAELPPNLPFTLAKASTKGAINMDGVKFVVQPAPTPATINSYLPNWPIRELFFLVNPKVLETKSQDEFESVSNEILDKLSTGEIGAWGRAIDGARRLPLAPIPESYWQQAKLNVWLLDSEADGGNVLQATPRSDRSRDRTQYAEIQINKLQAEMVYAPLSLRDAACLAYSKVEGTEYEEIVCGLNRSVEERISYFECAMMMFPCRMYGKRLPSPVKREIPQSAMGHLHPVTGKDELTSDFAAGSEQYVEVTVNHADFNRYVRDRLLMNVAV